ncbi:ABC transporter permease [Cohnella candidum]|uniref:Uncharacterized protein n=1 Tax=Cohnella candidum TaxID=2674991 RepID=A0A3G3JWY7_9BACL|nr:ABC transporter permease subunit [Cohnella candidum]AYQ72377.1 hypothetical protein EAV92_07195 [Cohnella candidum]
MMWLSFAGKEIFRKKIVLVSCVLTLLFVLLYSFGLWNIAEHMEPSGQGALQRAGDSVILLSLGLLFSQMIMAFLVFFATMGAVTGEIENGLLFAVLARPISRWKVYLGKYAGYAVWMVLYSAVLFWCILLPAHYILHVPLVPEAAFKSFLLFVWMPLLLLPVSLLGSVYLPMLGNGVACAVLYGVSLFSGFVENVSHLGSAKPHPAIDTVAFLTSLLMPANGIFHRMTYELAGGANLPMIGGAANELGPFSPVNTPSAAFVVYSFAYLALLLGWGCSAFTKKDIV